MKSLAKCGKRNEQHDRKQGTGAVGMKNSDPE